MREKNRFLHSSIELIGWLFVFKFPNNVVRISGASEQRKLTQKIVKRARRASELEFWIIWKKLTIPRIVYRFNGFLQFGQAISIEVQGLEKTKDKENFYWIFILYRSRGGSRTRSTSCFGRSIAKRGLKIAGRSKEIKKKFRRKNKKKRNTKKKLSEFFTILSKKKNCIWNNVSDWQRKYKLEG